MRGFSSSVLSCLERERLEEELSEARTRERMALDEREQTAQARLRDHDMEHGCQR